MTLVDCGSQYQNVGDHPEPTCLYPGGRPRSASLEAPVQAEGPRASSASWAQGPPAALHGPTQGLWAQHGG